MLSFTHTGSGRTAAGLLTTLTALGAAPAALAGELHVPADYFTIQEAISFAAASGDEVVVAPGTYNESIRFMGKAVVVRSADPTDPAVVAATVIDATGIGAPAVRCYQGEGPDAVLAGLTITGATTHGGGMDISGASPTVSDCVFIGNSAVSGGGMNIWQGSPTVLRCTFIGNTATGNGGGIACNVESNPSVTDCLFDGNSAHHGAGMSNAGGSPQVSGCVFLNNAADERGGGMYNLNADPTVTGCTFDANEAGYYGGGISSENGSAPTVEDCTFTGNSAPEMGGGIYTEGSSVTLRTCTFEANVAGYGGGGVASYLFAGMDLTSCRFHANAASEGGGMFAAYSDVTAVNCAFVANTADRGAGLYGTVDTTIRMTNGTITANVAAAQGGGVWAYIGSFTFENSIIRGNDGGEIVGDSGITATYCNITDGFAGTGNIDADPLFVSADDLRLQPGSPCIDAANSAFVPAAVTTDLGGLPRFVDDPDTPDTGAPAPPVVDMGAHEFQPPAPPCPADLDGDGAVGFGDLVAVLSAWGPCEAPDCPADLDEDLNVGFTDLVIVLSAWGPCPCGCP